MIFNLLSKAKTILTRAFSSAGSEHLPYKQRVGGSNPSTPTETRNYRASRVQTKFAFRFKLKAMKVYFQIDLDLKKQANRRFAEAQPIISHFEKMRK